MKKTLFVGLIMVIIIGLLSSKAGLVAGSVYMLIWIVIFIMATYDYFSLKSWCENVEQVLDTRETYLKDLETATTALTLSRDKLKACLEDFKSLPEEKQKDAKKWIEIFTEAYSNFEKMSLYAAQRRDMVVLQSNAMVSFMVSLSKEPIESYQKREYPFHYHPSERVLAVINNQ